jgi:hypothetical protein
MDTAFLQPLSVSGGSNGSNEAFGDASLAPSIACKPNEELRRGFYKEVIKILNRAETFFLKTCLRYVRGKKTLESVWLLQ